MIWPCEECALKEVDIEDLKDKVKVLTLSLNMLVNSEVVKSGEFITYSEAYLKAHLKAFQLLKEQNESGSKPGPKND